MNTFSDVVSKLGGPAVVADHLGMTPDGVRKLAKRNAMPTKHWPKLILLAEQQKVRGLSANTLARIAVARPQ